MKNHTQIALYTKLIKLSQLLLLLDLNEYTNDKINSVFSTFYIVKNTKYIQLLWKPYIFLKLRKLYMINVCVSRNFKIRYKQQTLGILIHAHYT